jgi:hypothetical protein
MRCAHWGAGGGSSQPSDEIGRTKFPEFVKFSSYVSNVFSFLFTFAMEVGEWCQPFFYNVSIFFV